MVMNLLECDEDELKIGETGNQGLNVGSLWENQPWGVSNSNNSGEGKEKIDMIKQPNQNEGNEVVAFVNKKRSRGIGTRSEKNVTNGEGKDGKCHESDNEVHIWTERERRKKMRNMFASLHALLPQLPPKADKSTIVDEAVNYIKNLQQTLEKLERQKQERLQSISPIGCESSVINSQWHPYEGLFVDQGSSNNMSNAMTNSNPSNACSVPRPPVAFQTWSSPNVVLNICGDEAQFCICANKKPGVLTTIAFVLEKHKIDVISANILCNGNGMCMILAHAKRASHQFQDANSTNEIYRQAAGEIMLWIA